MEETKKKENLEIVAKDLNKLRRLQQRHVAEIRKPGSALNKFGDALNQLPENKKWILFLHHAENQSFKVIATEMSLPYHAAQQVKNIHDESMEKIEKALGLSEDEISDLFSFQDFQRKAQKVIDTLSL